MNLTDRTYPTYTLLGTRVHALNRRDLLYIITEAVSRGEKWIIANHNLHSIYLYHHDSKMREFYARAQYVYIDGMPIVWLGRLLGLPLKHEHRVTLLDWLRPLMHEAMCQGWRVFFLGSNPRVGARAVGILRGEFPGLQIETAHGYFDVTPGSPENESVVSRIQEYRPHILIAGMGMPRQEHWILDELKRIEFNVVFNAGGIMDLVAGAVPSAPRWMGRVGLEGLYRLSTEPRRLWKRYLGEPGFILGLLVRDYRTRRES